MSAPINIPKKSDEYHRQKILYKQKMWEGKYIKQIQKTETKAVSVKIFGNHK